MATCKYCAAHFHACRACNLCDWEWHFCNEDCLKESEEYKKLVEVINVIPKEQMKHILNAIDLGMSSFFEDIFKVTNYE